MEPSIRQQEQEDVKKIVETIISILHDEEMIGIDNSFMESFSDNLIEKNGSLNILGEVLEYSDKTVENFDFAEKPISKTNVKKNARVDFKCEQCDDIFQRASDFENHMSLVHQTSKRLSCSYCDKSYSTKRSLNNHLSKNHKSLDKSIYNQVDSNYLNKIENYTTQCGSDSNIEISAGYRNDFSKAVVNGMKPEFFPENNIYFEEAKQEENLDDDFKWKEDPNADNETITPSGSQKSGKRQMKKSSSYSGGHVPLAALHSCGLCGKKCRTVKAFKSHIKSHSSIQPYKCQICGKAYKNKKALDVHIGMHNGINPFTCEYCNKSFTQKAGLKKHTFIHIGVTRFQCELCGKTYIHQKSFDIHKRTHTDEKFIKCPECGLALLSRSHLTRHLRVHTGERPYACSICGKCFAEKYNLNAHVRIHDDTSENGPRIIKNHICHLCGMSYNRKHKLEYHLTLIHIGIDNKGPQDQETLFQPNNEYFQENSQNYQIFAENNNMIDHYGNTAMTTFSDMKLLVPFDGAPIMITTLPQQSQTNLVPLDIPNDYILSYSPTSSNNNDQSIDGH